MHCGFSLTQNMTITFVEMGTMTSAENTGSVQPFIHAEHVKQHHAEHDVVAVPIMVCLPLFVFYSQQEKKF